MLQSQNTSYPHTMKMALSMAAEQLSADPNLHKVTYCIPGNIGGQKFADFTSNRALKYWRRLYSTNISQVWICKCGSILLKHCFFVLLTFSGFWGSFVHFFY